MSIIGILALLAAPSFIGKTEEANRTKHIANVRVLEDAAERYFIDHGKWPRGEEEPYTPEEVTAYAERIFVITGEEVVLEEGHYWDIDYAALSQYAKLPDEDDRANYVLRNPVGAIYYLEGLTKDGAARTTEVVEPTTEPESRVIATSYENDGEAIVFHGLGSAAFDGNLSSYHTGVGTVTWDGNLSDREITITAQGYNSGGWYYMLSVTFYDAAGGILKPVNASQDTTLISNTINPNTVKVVVPEGAVKMVFTTDSKSNVRIHEIQVTK